MMSFREFIKETRSVQEVRNYVENLKENMNSTNIKSISIDASTPRGLSSNSIENKKFSNTHTFYTPSYISFFITAIAIERFIKEFSSDCVTSDRDGDVITQGYEYDYGVVGTILTKGKVTFVYEGDLFEYSLHLNALNIKINFNNGEKLLKELENVISGGSNFLKNKHVYLYQTDDGIAWKIKKPPTIRWENLIMDKKLKEAIYDATIMHMRLLGTSSGSISYGIQGGGKSFVCQSLICEALSEGFSTCHLTSAVNFEELDELLTKYLTPCLVVLEDIDSFAQDREAYENAGLSNFLQFLSGVTEKSENINIMATTNFIDKLDKAVNDRPMRFNQKFLIDYLEDEERNQILDLYFKEQKLTETQKALCCKKIYKAFTASHISAIYERFSFLKKKDEFLKLESINLFEKALEDVSSHFKTMKSKKGVGFN